MSVYSINNYSVSTTYSSLDIVKYTDGNWYYSQSDNNLGNLPSATSLFWGGIVTYRGQTYPNFIFTPGYNTKTSISPTIKSVKFGDGYEQRVRDGIYITLLKIDCNFDLRSDKECEAINHFLATRAGTDAFVFIPLKPFDIQRLFVCKSWTSNLAFRDNNTISAQFEEVPA